MRTLRTILVSAVFGGAFLVTATASADGLTVAPSALSAEAQAKLAADISSARAANPKAFDAVRHLKGIEPSTYGNFRNPRPNVIRELRGIGKAGIVPMLEALAIDAPARADHSDAEWEALKVGMLEVLGELKDKRALPVLRATFEAGGQSPAVLTAAGRAIGRLGSDAELALLTQHAVKGDSLLIPAITGLGELRRTESAKHLAALLASTQDASVAAATAEALGILGSSWAWLSLGPKAEAKGLEVRKICAEALVPGYARQKGKARAAAGDAILMVDHPSTVTLLENARSSAKTQRAALDQMIGRVQQQRQRQQRRR